MKVEGCLGCSNYEMVELKILRTGGKAAIRTRTLNIQRGNFSLFKDLLSRISWVRALEKKEVQESWSIFKHHSFPPCSRPVHSHEPEIKQRGQESFMDEQGVSDKSRIEE